MTREEFARRWLTPGGHASQKSAPVGQVRLTDARARVFREKSPAPVPLVQAGRALQKWSLIAVGAGVFFAVMAAVLVKLGPYVSDYAATYLTPR